MYSKYTDETGLSLIIIIQNHKYLTKETASDLAFSRNHPNQQLVNELQKILPETGHIGEKQLNVFQLKWKWKTPSCVHLQNCTRVSRHVTSKK